MHNVANVRHPRLTATVWGSLLQLYIPTHRTQIEVRHKNGELATTVTSREASLLAYRGMVAGHINRDCLRYLLLRCPKSVAVRVLALDPPKRNEITIAKSSGLRWAHRLDRSKLGIPAAHYRLTYTPREVVMKCVGGIETRRAVDA